MKVLVIALLCVVASQVVLATPVASPAPKAGRLSIPLQSKKSRLVKRDSGGVALTGDNGYYWYGTISVGTPLVDYTVMFDTGSADLILPGANCESNCKGHTLYDSSQSSDSQDLGIPFELHMGDGTTASGEQYTDTISIAGLTATGQTIGVASSYSSGLAVDQFKPDGIMGMAFEEISVLNSQPVMQTLISQGQVSEPVFAFKLSTSGSELTIGGVNPEHYTGDFTYASVKKKAFWEVNIDSINKDGTAVISNFNAIIDTGATGIVLSLQDAKQIHAAVPGSKDASSTVGPGYYTFPCDSIPSISLTIGGMEFEISKETLNLGQVSEGSSDCVSGIMGSKNDDAVIGAVFLQNVYTKFDIGNTRVEFAKLA
ncbi:acid protease [Ramicandelaber brevisporus]|nr:acid protease [Ramicandelaber brevisporus]